MHRGLKEIARMHADPELGITVSVDETNERHIHATIAGPVDSPYYGGVFKLELFIPEGYPIEPPKAHFLTRIYHPNIDNLGRICLNILKDEWRPAQGIRTLLISLQLLLSTPNPDDPLNTKVAEHWKNNEEEAIQLAKEWTKKYAMETVA